MHTMVLDSRSVVCFKNVVGNVPHHADAVKRCYPFGGQHFALDTTFTPRPTLCDPASEINAVLVHKLSRHKQITVIFKVQLCGRIIFFSRNIACRLPPHTKHVQPVDLHLREIALDLTLVNTPLGHDPYTERKALRRKISFQNIKVAVFVMLFFCLLEHDVPSRRERSLQLIEQALTVSDFIHQLKSLVDHKSLVAMRAIILYRQLHFLLHRVDAVEIFDVVDNVKNHGIFRF